MFCITVKLELTLESLFAMCLCVSDPPEPALLSDPPARPGGHWEGMWCGLWASSVLCQDGGGEDPPKVKHIQTTTKPSLLERHTVWFSALETRHPAVSPFAWNSLKPVAQFSLCWCPCHCYLCCWLMEGVYILYYLHKCTCIWTSCVCRNSVHLLIRKVQYAPEKPGPQPMVETSRSFLMSDRSLHLEASLDKEVTHSHTSRHYVMAGTHTVKRAKCLSLSQAVLPWWAYQCQCAGHQQLHQDCQEGEDIW